MFPSNSGPRDSSDFSEFLNSKLPDSVERGRTVASRNRNDCCIERGSDAFRFRYLATHVWRGTSVGVQCSTLLDGCLVTTAHIRESSHSTTDLIGISRGVSWSKTTARFHLQSRTFCVNARRVKRKSPDLSPSTARTMVQSYCDSSLILIMQYLQNFVTDGRK